MRPRRCWSSWRARISPSRAPSATPFVTCCRSASGWPTAALDALLADAGRRADDAVSLHEFTHRLNQELPQSEKLAIVEMLWRVSYADGRIDKHEEQLIQRIAGLLHISDRDRVRLKLKVVVDGR